MIRSLAIVLLGVASSSLACGAATLCEGQGCECAPERQLFDGTCCVGFTQPGMLGCEPRVWESPQTITDADAGTAREVFAAVDANGAGLVAWIRVPESQVDAELNIASEDRRSQTWASFEPGLGLEGFGTRGSLAVGPRGEAMVTWRQQLVEDSRIHVAARGDDGIWATTSDAEPLSYPRIAGQPFAHISDSGEAFVVYNQFHEGVYGVAVARRAADTPDAPFERPTGASDILSPRVQFSNAPHMATGRNGDAIITWYQSPTPAGDLVVYASRRLGNGGEFSRPKLPSSISPPGGTIHGSIHRIPTPVMNDSGAAAVVWTQYNRAGALAVYLARFDGKRDWFVPVDIDDSFSDSEFDARGALPVLTDDGELFIAWTEMRPDRNAVVVAHRRADGVFDAPGSAPVAVSTEAANAIDHAMASGPDGEAIIVWSETDGSAWRVMARARNAGASQWSEAAQLSADQTVDALEPSVAIGSGGRVIVSWLAGPFGARWVETTFLEVSAPT